MFFLEKKKVTCRKGNHPLHLIHAHTGIIQIAKNAVIKFDEMFFPQ